MMPPRPRQSHDALQKRVSGAFAMMSPQPGAGQPQAGAEQEEDSGLSELDDLLQHAHALIVKIEALQQKEEGHDGHDGAPHAADDTGAPSAQGMP